ncbi:LSM domain-containing protein [Caldiplasma sukawensis]
MMLPMKMLEDSLSKKVSVLIKDNRVYEGTLAGFDEFMNMVLETAEEMGENSTRKLGKIILRGSNIVRITKII